MSASLLKFKRAPKWVQAVNEMGVGRGEEMCRKNCPYNRQLAIKRTGCFENNVPFDNTAQIYLEIRVRI